MTLPLAAPPVAPLDVFACPLAGSHLIEASAGTGKTWNICGLYLRLLLERQLTVQQILVVTFTKAATAELRERIRARIADTLAVLRGQPASADDPFVPGLLAALRGRGAEDGHLRALAEEALQTFDEASIFTIHGFCQRALADAPFASGLPLRMALLADDRELLAQVVEDFWRAEVVAAPAPLTLAAHLLACKDSPSRWAGLLGQRLARPLSQPVWPDDIDEPVGALDDAAALQAAHAEAAPLWRSDREQLIDALREVRDCLNGNTHRWSSVEQAIADWDTLAALPDPRVAPALDKLHLLAHPRIKLTPAKARGRTLRDHPFWHVAERVVQAREPRQALVQRARLQLLRRLFDQAPDRLAALKRERRVVAFDDMLSNLHERLRAPGSTLPAALRERFPAALIDEFQDTDPLQFGIFERIYLAPEAGEPPLYFVGDPKQAIYSFRNADLPTYLRASAAVRGRHTLGRNQRSSAALIAGLNGLFQAHPRAFVTEGLHYQPVGCGDKPRRPLADLSGEPRAPLQLWTLPPGPDGGPPRKTEAMAAVARATAAEIARLLHAAQDGRLRLGTRALGGGDIAVLVRSHAQGARMRQALAALGVGSVELSQASVFASPDAEELQQLMAAVLEPGRQGQLRRALATALLGLDAPAIDALGRDELGWLGWVERLLGYQAQWRRAGVGVMLRRLLHDEGIARRMLCRADGERRLTNLLHLAEALHQAQAEGHESPAALMRWFAQARRQAREGRQDEAAQLRLESDRHLVQIVTIHKSKGLEYPIVFCPFLWAGSKAQAGPLGKDAREYAGPDGRRVVDFSAGRDAEAVKRAQTLERAAEDLRLIYVALTRAVHRCYLPVGTYLAPAGGRLSATESTKGTLNWLAAGPGLTPDDWFHAATKALDGRPAAIAAAWAGLAAGHAPHIGLSPLPQAPGRPVALPQPDPDALAVQAPPAHIPPAWWIGSYTSLSGGSRHEAAAWDHDAVPSEPGAPAGADDASAARRAVAPDADDILRFPRGAEAGSCLHAIFERADFTQPDSFARAIDDGLQAWAPALARAGLAPAQAHAMARRMLHDVLQVPIPMAPTAAGPLRLADLPRERRLVELEFNLPAPGLRARDLAAVLQAHGYPVPPLSFGELQGYLRGFIDLVAEHGGRYVLIDWKSNHLGDQPGDYLGASLDAAMRTHGYALQYLLYTVALHRYLAHALPGYDYDRHVGGVAYLFVRGMRPGWTGPDGTPAGVFHDRPPRELVQALDRLLGAPMPAGHAPAHAA